MFMTMFFVLLIYGMLHFLGGVWCAALLIRVKQEFFPLKSRFSISLITAVMVVGISSVWIGSWLLYGRAAILGQTFRMPVSKDFFAFLLWLFIYVWANSELVLTLLKSKFKQIEKIVAILFVLFVLLFAVKPVFHDIFYKFYLEHTLTQSALNSDYLENHFQKYRDDADIRQIIARHPNTSLQVLSLLGHSASLKEREYVARNPSTPNGMLMSLAKDPVEEVRLSVLSNVKIPWQALLVLLNDNALQVKTAAERRFAQRESKYIEVNDDFKKATLRQDIDYSVPTEYSLPLNSFPSYESSNAWIWFVVLYPILVFIMFLIYKKKRAEQPEVPDLISAGWIAGISGLVFISVGLIYNIVFFEYSIPTWLSQLGQWWIIYASFLATLYIVAMFIFSCIWNRRRLCLKGIALIATIFLVSKCMVSMLRPLQYAHSMASIDFAPSKVMADMHATAATNHNASPVLLREIFMNSRIMHGALASNRNLPDDIMEQLAGEKEYSVQIHLIDNPNDHPPITRQVSSC